MLEASNDFEELEEADFPAFPVSFKPDPEETQSISHLTISKSRVAKGPFRLPEHDIRELQGLMGSGHRTVYNQLFQESWENGPHNIDNFFSIYHPLDPEFVQEMKLHKLALRIVRLSSHKIYVGEFRGERCSGRSIIVFKNGNIYEGMMRDNKRDGKGFYLEAGVGWFKGTFANDSKAESGVEVVYNKWAFQGQFLNGLRHEKGLYLEKGGTVYYGQWKLGIMHGKATLKTPSSSYHGMLVNSLKHGQGEERFTNGDSFKGEYQNNRFDGFGTYCWEQGQASYEGGFRNGLRHGKGKWSSGETKYSGSYAEGLKEGYGELYFSGGNFYKGNFVEDRRQGYGEMFWTDGSFYKGDWKGGVQNGKGQIYLSGGQIVSGLFENSILVQVIPSIYEKQMEISAMGIQDLFGSAPKLPTSNKSNKTKTYSQSKNMSQHGARKKLTKIDEGEKRRKHSIKDHIQFQTPTNAGRSQPIQLRQQPNSPNTTAFPRTQQHIAAHSPASRNLPIHGHGHSHGKQGEGRECKCMRRLENFRLRQRMKTKINESKVEQTLNHHGHSPPNGPGHGHSPPQLSPAQH